MRNMDFNEYTQKDFFGNPSRRRKTPPRIKAYYINDKKVEIVYYEP